MAISASALVLLLSNKAGSMMASKTISLSYTNDDTWSFSFTRLSGTPLGNLHFEDWPICCYKRYRR